MHDTNQSFAFLGIPISFTHTSLFFFFLSFIILCLILTSCFGTTALVSHCFLVVTNAQNIHIVINEGAKKLKFVSLLIPEYTVSVGALYFSLGTTWFSRSKFNLLPLSPLINAGSTIDPHLPVDIRDAYVKVRREALQFGYATAETCGGKSAATIMFMNSFVFSAMIIGVICEVAGVILASVFYFSVKKHITVPGRDLCIECNFKKMIFLGEQKKVRDFMKLAHLFKRRERTMSVLLFVFVIVGVFFLFTAKIIEDVLRHSVMKCGRSFCEQYDAAMRGLFLLLPSYNYQYSCGVGSSSVLLLVTVIFAFVVCLPVLIILVAHFLSSYPLVTIKRAVSGGDESSNINREVELVWSAASDNTKPPATNINLSSNEVSETKSKEITAAEENVRGMTRLGKKSDFGFYEMETNGELRDIKKSQCCSFFDAEKDNRAAIEILQEFEFFVYIKFLKKKVLRSGYMLTLHQLFLCSFVGPFFKLHVCETYFRQQSWLKYCSELLNKLELLKKKTRETLVLEHLWKMKVALVSMCKELSLTPQHKVTNDKYARSELSAGVGADTLTCCSPYFSSFFSSVTSFSEVGETPVQLRQQNDAGDGVFDVVCLQQNPAKVPPSPVIETSFFFASGAFFSSFATNSAMENFSDSGYHEEKEDFFFTSYDKLIKKTKKGVRINNSFAVDHGAYCHNSSAFFL